ncbi:MAG: ABC transporter ATP-binding protein [Proteobacteria bacterium]|nr:MAG: ABC transporter ATP-binding protein [Pseudomonadota bacterium]
MKAQEEAAVSCRGLTKVYESGGVRTPALRGVDLDVKPGELMMLVGPSGCGKTTLLSVIAGILNYDQGECRVYGRDLSRLSDEERTRFRGENLGFVFQAFNLIPTISARENVAVPLLIRGQPWEESMLRAGQVLEEVGLTDKLDTSPRELSGGQQQRVAIARALVHNPKLLVCDEPTSALDHDTGQNIMKILRDVALAGGRALIIVTHDVRIFSFADRIARMEDGVIHGVEGANEEGRYDS